MRARRVSNRAGGDAVRHPETAGLASRAYKASGAKTHPEFVAILGGAVGLRTFRGWLAGEQPAAPIAQLVLREIATGWRPLSSGYKS